MTQDEYDEANRKVLSLFKYRQVAESSVVFDSKSDKRKEVSHSFVNWETNAVIKFAFLKHMAAVMPLGDTELQLVAMFSRKNQKQCPCFWDFKVTSGIYNSCVVMSNLECLGIVFDLDDTLIVANTSLIPAPN